MDLEVRASIAFDAGHKASTRERCRRQHGHHWTVTAAVRVRDGDPEDADVMFGDLVAIAAEWRDRDLNEMIPNFSETVPERLAPWIMERLLARSSQMLLVEVSDGLVTASLRREPTLR